MTPHNSFEMHSSDIALTLEDWLESDIDPALWSQVVIWHTHPGGMLGPSPADVRHRVEKCGNLVITLYDEGDAKATWY